MSILLVLDSGNINASDSTNDFTITWNNPINLPGNWEIALISANLWYSWYNISSANGNNTFRYWNGATYRSVTIPDGQYSISQLNNYLHSIMYTNGDYTLSGTGLPVYDIEITANLSTLRVHLVFTNSYKLDLGTGNLYLLLGGLQTEYSTDGDLENVANINNNINSILLRNNRIKNKGCYINSIASDVIYQFVPESIPGSNLIIQPLQKIYVPLDTSDGSLISMRVYITTNLGIPLALNDEPVTYLYHIRKSVDVSE